MWWYHVKLKNTSCLRNEFINILKQKITVFIGCWFQLNNRDSIETENMKLWGKKEKDREHARKLPVLVQLVPVSAFQHVWSQGLWAQPWQRQSKGELGTCWDYCFSDSNKEDCHWLPGRCMCTCLPQACILLGATWELSPTPVIYLNFLVKHHLILPECFLSSTNPEPLS